MTDAEMNPAAPHARGEAPDVCDFCHFGSPPDGVKPYKNGPASWQFEWLCALCMGTRPDDWYADTATRPIEAMEIMRTICYVGNAVIAEIRKGFQSASGGKAGGNRTALSEAADHVEGVTGGRLGSDNKKVVVNARKLL